MHNLWRHRAFWIRLDGSRSSKSPPPPHRLAPVPCAASRRRPSPPEVHRRGHRPRPCPSSSPFLLFVSSSSPSKLSLPGTAASQGRGQPPPASLRLAGAARHRPIRLPSARSMPALPEPPVVDPSGYHPPDPCQPRWNCPLLTIRLSSARSTPAPPGCTPWPSPSPASSFRRRHALIVLLVCAWAVALAEA